jgi:hypothetical protein
MITEEQDRERVNKNGVSSIPAPSSFNTNSFCRLVIAPSLLNPKTQLKGDAPLLHAAREEARNSFRKNASLLPEDPALAPAIAHAEDVAKILRENVVQGKKTEDDRYSKLFLKVEVEEMLIM